MAEFENENNALKDKDTDTDIDTLSQDTEQEIRESAKEAPNPVTEMPEEDEDTIVGIPPLPGFFPDDDEETKDTSGESAGGSSQQDPKKPMRGRGLYRYIKISVSTLDKIIAGLAIALIVCMAIGLSNRGYLIEFDSMGGTTVESEKLMYGDLVEEPVRPYREGYVFTGWYRNADCLVLWHFDTDEVSEPMTLYAGWEMID